MWPSICLIIGMTVGGIAVYVYTTYTYLNQYLAGYHKGTGNTCKMIAAHIHLRMQDEMYKSYGYAYDDILEIVENK